MASPAKALTFVVCVNDPDILKSNLLASPCLAPGTPHEVITVGNAPNAAEGLNGGLQRARNELVVCVHQDVFLPEDWDKHLIRQYRLAEKKFGPIGVTGVYGVGEVREAEDTRLSAQRIGWVR